MTIRDLFPGYLGKSEGTIREIWENGAVFVDANVLLSLYTYSDETLKEFKKVFSNNKFSNRIFITYQVGLEYSRNRIKRTNHQNEAFDQIKKKIEENRNELESWIRREYRFHSFIDLSAIGQIINQAASDAIRSIGSQNSKDMEEKYKNLDQFIIDMVGFRITDKPSESRLNEIFKDGKSRYERLIPPGFEDRKKPDDSRTYGDLTAWLEMIRYAKDNSITSLIYVTDDLKDDWWWRENGRIVGPHPLLVQEMLDNGVAYHQYTSESFLKFASEEIGGSASKEALSEAREVAKKQPEGIKYAGIAKKVRRLLRDPESTFLLLDNELEQGTIDKEEHSRLILREIENLSKRLIARGYPIEGSNMKPILQKYTEDENFSIVKNYDLLPEKQRDSIVSSMRRIAREEYEKYLDSRSKD